VRRLLRSSAFIRAAKGVLKKHPGEAESVRSTLVLSLDAFHSRLRTHKLRGELEGSWACSAGYDLRIVFRFVQYEGAEAILLETIGTHDEIY